MTDLLAHHASGGQHLGMKLLYLLADPLQFPNSWARYVFSSRTKDPRFFCRSPASTKLEARRWYETEAVSNLFLLFLLNSNLSWLSDFTPIFPAQLLTQSSVSSPSKVSHGLYNQFPVLCKVKFPFKKVLILCHSYWFCFSDWILTGTEFATRHGSKTEP